MKIKNVMTKDVACCSPDAGLQEVAQMMVEHDCGGIPVCDGQAPIGFVTDRDIVCRVVAHGNNPLELKARDIMTQPCVTISQDATLKDCAAKMEEHQIRRILVVDDAGKLCGVVAQADVARNASKQLTGEVVAEVSEPEAAGV